MKLFTREALSQLIKNGIATRKAMDAEPFVGEPDHFPVVKIFNPYGPGVWLLTELSQDGNMLYGLCDLGTPELGYVSKAELETMRVTPSFGVFDARGKRINGDSRNYRKSKEPKALPLERDKNFSTRYRLTVWLETAQRAGKITEDETALATAFTKLKRRDLARQVAQLQATAE